MFVRQKNGDIIFTLNASFIDDDQDINTNDLKDVQVINTNVLKDVQEAVKSHNRVACVYVGSSSPGKSYTYVLMTTVNYYNNGNVSLFGTVGSYNGKNQTRIEIFVEEEKVTITSTFL